jgi:hypothetical protein
MKEDDEEDGKDLQKEIEKEGTQASAEDTFELLPGNGVVIFVIKDPPGQKGKALALQLPLPLAISLGNALVNCAILASKIHEEPEKEEEKKEEKVTWH